MGWDWVKVLKEEMLDLKPDEHLSRHAATDRLAWVSSQAPARAPSPVDEWRDYPPNTPPAGGALLGFEDHVSDAGRGSRSPLSGFNAGPLYGGADAAPREREDVAGPVEVPGARPELPNLNDFDFAMPTAPPLEFPAAQAPGGFGSPIPGASIVPNAAPAASPFGAPPPPVALAPAAPPVSFPPAPAPAAFAPSPPAQPSVAPSSMPGLNLAAPQGGYGQSGYGQSAYGDGGLEQGYVLTLLIDGVLAGVALPGGGEVSVGRERQSTLVIPESKQTVSRRAASLVRTGLRTVEARIENRNGAWVTRQLPEGTRQEFIERGKSVTLRIGDRLSLDPPGTVVVGLGEPH